MCGFCDSGRIVEKAGGRRKGGKVGFDICGSETDDDTPPLPTQAHAKAGPLPKPTFAGFFNENHLEGNGFKLQFHDFKDDVVVLDESDETWGFSLIGCFMGLFPGRPTLDSIVRGLDGFLVFRFLNEDDLLHVFHAGPYMAFGKKLMLKIVDEGVMLTDDLFMQVPTWVLLHEVPLSVWSESGLSKLSFKVGTLLYTDKVTKDRSKMNYARCLVEVNVSRPPVLEFGVKMSGGRRYVQKFSYEHYPEYCCECKKFGHNLFKCPKVANGGADPAATALASHAPPPQARVSGPSPKTNNNVPSLMNHDEPPFPNSHPSKPSTSKSHSSKRLLSKSSSSKISTSSSLVAPNPFGVLNVEGSSIGPTDVNCDSNMADVGCLNATLVVVDPKAADGCDWQHVSRMDKNKGHGGAVSSSVSQ
ncbi:hypothetical protein LIER_20773 [Lithospermum erythrorhizon]|uniref:DUF4283 domain-containing protein n=1 Tax=Lithospermum erythrorhizon TaxID=34254 RepID=A0AAV3QMQ1_LITER